MMSDIRQWVLLDPTNGMGSEAPEGEAPAAEAPPGTAAAETSAPAGDRSAG